MTELAVAKELGMTLVQLREAMTPEELWLWAAFFQLQNEEQKAEMEKARRRR